MPVVRRRHCSDRVIDAFGRTNTTIAADTGDMTTDMAMVSVSIVIPLQPVSSDPAPASYERGTANAKRVHAVRKTLNGPRALCFTGLPVTRLGGRFDPLEPEACEDCAFRISQ
jgi:hypothetical protein